MVNTFNNRIVVTTASCAFCNGVEEGAELSLTGLQDYNTCQTNKLDHPDMVDYLGRGEFFTDNDDKEEDGWGDCYEVSKHRHHCVQNLIFLFQSLLNGKVRKAEVTWLASGTWTVDNICFDWDDPDYNVWICTGDGTSLTAYYTLILECSESDITSCP